MQDYSIKGIGHVPRNMVTGDVQHGTVVLYVLRHLAMAPFQMVATTTIP